MKITWRATARRQLEHQIEYVRARSPQSADRLLRRVEFRIAQLIDFPRIGTLSHRGVRELVITKTPYIVVYQLRGDEIVILRLFHAAQSR